MTDNTILKQKGRRVVILGDSLVMPRIEDGITYEATYPFLLQQEGYDVIDRSKRANDTFKQSEPLNLSDDIGNYNADIYVIHLGIVDCAPRIFTKMESKILGTLPSFLRNPIINFASKHRRQITKYRNITYVNINDFKKNIEKIIRYIGDEKNIVLIKILNTNQDNIYRSYNIQFNISQFNHILDDVAAGNKCRIIDPNSLSCPEKLLNDGIHITPQMHRCIVNEIIATLNEK